MGLRQVTGFTCSRCGARLPARATGCADCGELGLPELAYDLREVARSLDRASLDRREPWLWRYKELLPLDELAELPSLQVGYTPVYGAPRLAAWAGVGGLWLKDEGRNPSGSLEDRASALASVEAAEAGRKTLALASFGPEAASQACFGAAAGQRTLVFAPDEALDDDLDLAAAYGALVLRVDGPFSAAAQLCAQTCRARCYFDRTPLASPYPFEGKKTAGLEIGEQLAERMPDWVVASDPTGETLAAVARGLEATRALGLVKAAPRILGVSSSPQLVPALAGRGEDPGWLRAGALLRACEGAAMELGDQRLPEARAALAERAALLPDDEGARAVAALKAAVEDGRIDRGATVLVLVNGRGVLAQEPSEFAEVGRDEASVEKALGNAGWEN